MGPRVPHDVVPGPAASAPPGNVAKNADSQADRRATESEAPGKPGSVFQLLGDFFFYYTFYVVWIFWFQFFKSPAVIKHLFCHFSNSLTSWLL